MNNDFDMNDPRLTAYALGELNGEEALEIEKRLDSDLALRSALDEIREAAGLVERELRAESSPGLTDEQRRMLLDQPTGVEIAVSTRRLVFPRVLAWGGSLAAAACLGIVLFLPVDSLRERTNTFALNDRKEALGRRDNGLTLWADKKAEVDQAIRDEAANVVNRFGLAPTKEINGATLDPQAGAAISLLNQAPPAPAEGDTFAGQSALLIPGKSIEAEKGKDLVGLMEYPKDWPQTSLARQGEVLRARVGTIEAPGSSGPAAHGGGGPGSPPRFAATPGGNVAIDTDGDGVVDKFWVQPQPPGTEAYNLITDNPFIKPTDEPLSTFSIDVDTASYSNVRRFLTSNSLPPKDAVRIEELINYFDYDYEAPSGENAPPFSTNVEINAAPWNPQHRLVRIGLRGRDVPPEMRPATSLVFLIDVSGSMQPPNKLPLVRDGLKLLVEKLNGDDRLAIVTYAGNAGLVMDSVYVNAENKPRILAAIDSLGAGGSTNGAGGLVMAYDVATQHFIKEGVNRVILCTDGDFNVGVSGDNELVRLIDERRTTGVFLSVLGFGTGNLKDGKMEQLANHGNGTFAYIDGIEEAKRTLVDRLSGTLVTIAKDVKIQIEFNPAQVAAYRLIGYENRVLAAQDFNDDRKDAGEIGAGHTVTALYEVVPVGVAIDPANPEPPPVDPLRYKKPDNAAKAAQVFNPPDQIILDFMQSELMMIKLRYKQPDAAESTKIELPVRDSGATAEQATPDFQFAAAVAGFGMILRDSPYKGQITPTMVLDLAGAAIGDDADGKRAEFMRLVEIAGTLIPAPASDSIPAQRQ